MLLAVKLLPLLLEHLIADAHVFFISFIVKFAITVGTPIQIHFTLLDKRICTEATSTLLLECRDNLLVNLVFIGGDSRRPIAVVLLLLLISIALVVTATSRIAALLVVVLIIIVVLLLRVPATATTIVV